LPFEFFNGLYFVVDSLVRIQVMVVWVTAVVRWFHPAVESMMALQQRKKMKPEE
jgi:hypothetical protein